MKSLKTYLCIKTVSFVLLLLIPLFSGAQDPADSIVVKVKPEYGNVIKIDFLGPVFDMFAVFYERKLGDNTSGQLEFRITPEGYIVTPELRYYLSDSKAPEGIYIAPWLRFGNAIPSLRENAVMGGGILVGAQTIKKRISLDAFIGPAVYGGGGAKSLTIARGGLILGFSF